LLGLVECAVGAFEQVFGVQHGGVHLGNADAQGAVPAGLGLGGQKGLLAVQDAYMSFPSGSVPVDSSTAAELIATDAALSPDTPILGYRFDIQVTFPGQTNKLYQLYRVDIGWSTASNGQEDP